MTASVVPQSRRSSAFHTRGDLVYGLHEVRAAMKPTAWVWVR